MTHSDAGSRREILARAEAGVWARRRAEVEDLEALLDWADAWSGDPQAEPGAVPVEYGGPRLIRVGGEGTPEVTDLCFAEIAIARRVGEVATRNATADALDLRHRLPETWAMVRRLECPAWVGGKVARMSRPLSKAAVGLVDAAVATAVGESPGRILAIAEATVIEADREAHRERIERARRRRGVWLSGRRVGELVDEADPVAGVRTLTGRLDEADALELDALIEDLAEALARHGDHDPGAPPGHDQLRAEAMALLARPDRALALLTGDQDGHETDDDTDADAGADAGADGEDAAAGDESGEDERGEDAAPSRVPVTGPAARTPAPSPRRREATMYAHLSADALAALVNSASTDAAEGLDGVARVEELGPMLLDQLARLLGHRRITLTPVIDLNQGVSVNAYEHPAAMKRRTRLRTVTDVFPHSTSSPETRVEHDHPTPHDPNGPPDQTGDHNDAPLTRRPHRAKTHLGYQVEQTGPGTYRWTTPHGLTRWVTPTGTHDHALLNGLVPAVRLRLPLTAETG